MLRDLEAHPCSGADKYDAVNEIKRCAGLRYLAVARKRAFTKPVADRASNTFQGGSIAVELLVFDLESEAYLGGFLANAKTPESLEGMSKSTNIDSYLHSYLGRMIYEAMRARLDP